MKTEDYNLIVCGQIFLTPNPDLDTGVRICKVKDGINWSKQELMDRCNNDYTIPRQDYRENKITLSQYEQIHREYHDNFDTTCTVNNVFNRMVSWKGGSLHGAKMTEKMSKRLCQYFFVQLI